MYAGVSFHPETFDAPEVTGLQNPLGIVRFEQQLSERTKLFCEHVSSIPVHEDGYGLNHCGVLIQLKGK